VSWRGWGRAAGLLAGRAFGNRPNGKLFLATHLSHLTIETSKQTEGKEYRQEAQNKSQRKSESKYLQVLLDLIMKQQTPKSY
jgi:hypothetical protein